MSNLFQTIMARAGKTFTVTDAGGAHGTARDDTFNLLKSGNNKLSQIHAYGGDGNDTFNLDVDVSSKHNFVYGHHIFLGSGKNTVVFNVTTSSQGKIVGRIDDFTYGRDNLFIRRDNGSLVEIDLMKPGEGIKIVTVLGQMAVLIDDKSLYILEGARFIGELPSTSYGVRNTNGEENHFPEWPMIDGVLDTFSKGTTTFAPSNNWAPSKYISANLRHLSIEEAADRAHLGPGYRFDGTALSEHIVSDNNQQRDIIYAAGGNDLVEAGKGRDTVFGGAGRDTIFGGTDRDVLYGGAENDLIHGGTESDTIRGDSGNDVLYGDAGDDYIYGGVGNDSISGGLGNNRLWGDGGSDKIYGGSGVDQAYGGAGSDLIYGRLGADLLFGGSENDTIYGGDAADSLYGDAGNDFLYGESGNDRIYGGAGADTISGGLGQDALYGGEGADVFIFSLGLGRDQVKDWQKNIDKIYINPTDQMFSSNIEYLKYIQNHISFTTSKVGGIFQTTIWYDPDGPSGRAQPQQLAILELSSGLNFTLTHDDFILL